MSDKPTAGECYYKRHNAHSLPHAYFVWKGDKPLAGPMQEKAAKESCDAINAALAAERERHDRAEERAKKWFDLLAAEREKTKLAKSTITQIPMFNENALRATIAEAQKPLVDALMRIRIGMARYNKRQNEQTIAFIDAALAKVGK